jgi:uncharacterized membrane protein (UPF0127 family)
MGMGVSALSCRLRELPRVSVLGLEVAVASRHRSRLLGLAYLDREQVGAGLLIPRCSSVHTFGMRFSLDVVFLDAAGAILSMRFAVPGRRFLWDRRADGVLELPARSLRTSFTE